MKIFSLFAVALLATTALLSTGCGEPEAAPAPADTPAADADADMAKPEMTEEPAGSTSS